MSSDMDIPFGSRTWLTQFRQLQLQNHPNEQIRRNMAMAMPKVQYYSPNNYQYTHELSEDIRMWHHVSNIFCGSSFSKLLLSLLIVSAFSSISSTTLYIMHSGKILGDPDILCISGDQFTSLSTLFILVVLNVAGLVFFIVFCCCRRDKSRGHAKITIMLAFGFFFVLLLVSGVWLNIFPSDMLIKDPSGNNAIYSCEFHNQDIEAFPVLFSLLTLVLESVDRKCEFRLARTICNMDIRKFLDSPDWIRVNNTVGAYYCSPSNPYGSSLCQDILSQLNAYSIPGMLLTCVTFVCFVFTWYGMRLQDNPVGYERLISCCVKCGCTCCDQFRPLLPGDSSNQAHLNY
jgi:hypothetical protein